VQDLYWIKLSPFSVGFHGCLYLVSIPFPQTGLRNLGRKNTIAPKNPFLINADFSGRSTHFVEYLDNRCAV
jgi:hypothetical protein